MLRSEKVATPFTALTVTVPDEAPPLGLFPILNVIPSLAVATLLPDESCTSTRTPDEMVAPAVVLARPTVKAKPPVSFATTWTTNTNAISRAAIGARPLKASFSNTTPPY